MNEFVFWQFSEIFIIPTYSNLFVYESAGKSTPTHPRGHPPGLKAKSQKWPKPSPHKPLGTPSPWVQTEEKNLDPDTYFAIAITICHYHFPQLRHRPPPQLGWVTVGPWASRSGGWPAARRQTPAPPRPPAAGAAGPPASPAAAAAGTGEPRRRCGPPGRPVRQCPAWSHTHRPPPLGNCSSSRSMGQQLLT